YAQILRRKHDLPDTQQHGLEVIERSGNYLLSLINDILDLSKIEARRLDLHATAFDFPKFLNGIAEMITIRTQEKGLRFQYAPPTSLPAYVHADEQRLSQILLNLLNNAVKFTEQGVITLRVKAYPSSSSQAPGQRSVYLIRFEVEDTGVGIPRHRIAHIFSPFIQVAEHTRTTEGTGLGLAISRSLVQMMGGEIHVNSVEGQGSRFWFEVDLPEAEYSPETRVLPPGRVLGYTFVTEEPQRPLKILIVDDQAENRSVLADMLKPLGFATQEAIDGQDAIDRTLDWRPDLIFMDLMLPHTDGFEATRRIRQHPAVAETVVIAVSASVFGETRAMSVQAGCDDFLAKPIQTPELLDCLQHHLHLEWIPADHPRREHTASPDPDQMALPSPERLQHLLQFAEMRSITDMRQLLSQLEAQEPSLAPFTKQFEQFTNTYQFTQMIETLTYYLQVQEEAQHC
ncbi:response regulator, partial [candidate division KSB3 bacterium]|nr:response regulator [candidate division KSB3 bacterium]MBD3325488.1 response regulator [candidate division KSB3 bacterium]